MSRVLVLTDSLLRDALTPEPNLAAPAGLLERISHEVARTPRRSRLGRLLPARPARPAAPSIDPRLALVFAALALLAALVVGAAVGARLLEDRTPDEPAVPPPSLGQGPALVELVPTEVETLASEATGYDEVVVDGRGAAWAFGAGHVTRFDPATGERRTWTESDDRTFRWSGLAPAAARAGGIWVWDGSAIRRFDGTGFRERIPAPDGASMPTAIAEGEPGILWAALTDGVSRWDGTSWSEPDGPGGCWRIVIPATDDPWLMCGATGQATVSHLADGSWVTIDRNATAAAARGEGKALSIAPDGSVWVASADAVARWASGGWTEIDGPGFLLQAVAITQNGDIWALSAERLPGISVRRDGTWERVATPGLPGEIASEIAVVDDRVFVGTDGGLYRYDEAGWVPAWPDPAVGPSKSSWPAGGLEPVSADEAWAADERGVWHFVDGRWRGPDRPAGLAPDALVRDLAVTSRGATVALATDDGVAVRSGAGWSWTPLRTLARDIDVAPDGSLWVATGTQAVAHLVETGGEWGLTTVTCPAGGWFVAVEPDGTVWTGGFGYSGTAGLARIREGACVEVFPLPDAPAATVDVVDLEAGPIGGIVAAVFEASAGPAWRLWIVRSEGAAWSALRGPETIDGWSGDLAIDARGRTWLSLPLLSLLERYEGGAWSPVSAAALDARWAWDLSFAPDGTLWLVSGSGVERIRPGALD